MFHKRIRAWHKKKKVMSKVLNLDFEDETVTVMGSMYGQNIDDVRIYDFDEVIIMQESGLQDDKKFNVFEGDLIRFENEVFLLNYGHYGDSKTKVNGYGWYIFGKDYTFLYVGGGERVGNAFENSELLEV